jgi:hypothetical protein
MNSSSRFLLVNVYEGDVWRSKAPMWKRFLFVQQIIYTSTHLCRHATELVTSNEQLYRQVRARRTLKELIREKKKKKFGQDPDALHDHVDEVLQNWPWAWQTCVSNSINQPPRQKIPRQTKVDAYNSQTNGISGCWKGNVKQADTNSSSLSLMTWFMRRLAARDHKTIRA